MCLLHLCGGHQIAFLTPKVIYTKREHIKQVSIHLLRYMHKQKGLWDHSMYPITSQPQLLYVIIGHGKYGKTILLLDFNVFICLQTSLRPERHYRIVQRSNLFSQLHSMFLAKKNACGKQANAPFQNVFVSGMELSPTLISVGKGFQQLVFLFVNILT